MTRSAEHASFDVHVVPTPPQLRPTVTIVSKPTAETVVVKDQQIYVDTDGDHHNNNHEADGDHHQQRRVFNAENLQVHYVSHPPIHLVGNGTSSDGYSLCGAKISTYVWKTEPKVYSSGSKLDKQPHSTIPSPSSHHSSAALSPNTTNIFPAF